MNRRDSLKYLASGTLATGFLFSSCEWMSKDAVVKSLWKYKYGRTPEEIIHDNNLLSQQFFDAEEINLIEDLGNIIIPPNSNGNIKEAEVVDFIEFIAKELIELQQPLRFGLSELNKRSINDFQKNFIDLNFDEKQKLLDPIAYPEEVSEVLIDQANFFSLLRDLVVTGYFTSEVGINDLGYVGNQPNVWDGVPKEILLKHNLEYDPEWESKFLNIEKRNDIAKWDEKGNLIS
ncbi:MAG: gluconate 2-dehydrogenase subunit 3 family protein [Flavobacteriaceae bacterium]|jgi:hypothetical protein|nr:gluconate 2-dehydrogenase subunit 3 family protein [Flavobacteriaceae bacterium]